MISIVANSRGRARRGEGTRPGYTPVKADPGQSRLAIPETQSQLEDGATNGRRKTEIQPAVKHPVIGGRRPEDAERTHPAATESATSFS